MMKKSLFVLLLCMAASCTSVLADASGSIFYEGFEGATYPSGWTATIGTNITYTVTDRDGGGSCLAISDQNAAGQSSVYKGITVQTGCIVATAEVFHMDYSCDKGVFRLMDGDKEALGLAVNRYGYLVAYDETGYKNTNLKLNDNAWNTVTAYVDIEQNTFVAAVNGNREKNIFKFKTPASKIDRFSFFTIWSPVYEIMLDEIKIDPTTPDQVSPHAYDESYDQRKLLPSETDIITAMNEKLGDAVAFKIGSTTAYSRYMKVQIDGQSGLAPFVENGSTLVPLPLITRGMGTDAVWDESGQEVTIESGEQTIRIQMNSPVMHVNHAEVPLAVPARIVSGRPFVPLREICAALSKTIFWDERGLVIVSDGDTGIEPAQDGLILLKLLETLDVPKEETSK
jgi:hypothetical protein